MPTATDIWGDTWAVEEARPTTHGWAVLLGRPACRRMRHGLTVIMADSLANYLERHRHEPAVLAASLPIGATAIKRLRRLLGHHWRDDRSAWWEERAADLADLTVAEFAARYGVSAGAASTWRIRLFGRRLRPAGWWREPEVAAVLRDQPTAAASARLGLSPGAVRRLRAELAAGLREPTHDA